LLFSSFPRVDIFFPLLDRLLVPEQARVSFRILVSSICAAFLPHSRLRLFTTPGRCSPVAYPLSPIFPRPPFPTCSLCQAQRLRQQPQLLRSPGTPLVTTSSDSFPPPLFRPPPPTSTTIGKFRLECKVPSVVSLLPFLPTCCFFGADLDPPLLAPPR